MKMYKELSRLYNALYDEVSQRNFLNRLANNLSGNGQYLVQMIAENCRGGVKSPNISEYYKGILDKKRVIVWGAFISGLTRFNFEHYLKMDEIYCFCDKDINKQKSMFCGKKVISPRQLVSEYRDCYVLIESKFFYDEIYQFLLENHFPEENIIKHGNHGIQYFDYEFMTFSDTETFIDGGCFDCESIKDFIRTVKGRYHKIIAFEPDHTNYDHCMELIQKEKIKNTTLINAALWSEETMLSFNGGNSSDSKVAESPVESNTTVKGISIDSFLKNENITFIKMDIEGSELNALKGAEETIRKNKPKLAVCIYHRPEDITDIQDYLMELVPEYQFGIRHYTDHAFETVLYAFVPHSNEE